MEAKTGQVMNNFPLGGSWNLIDFISPSKNIFRQQWAHVFIHPTGEIPTS
jgi:hypothetical protein